MIPAIRTTMDRMKINALFHFDLEVRVVLTM